MLWLYIRYLFKQTLLDIANSKFKIYNYNATFAKHMNTLQSKTPSQSHSIMNELILPNDTNTLGNLMGGRLMHWMDIAAALAAMRHCNCAVVTASVDNISFQSAVKLGNIVTLDAKVTRAFNTSMEVYLKVTGEDPSTQFKYISNEAYLTFVALDPNGRPRPVSEIIPETPEEQEKFDGALRRRQLRLVLGGKIKPEDATELKALFIK